MTNRRLMVQIILVFLGFLLIYTTYYFYPEFKEKKVVKERTLDERKTKKQKDMDDIDKTGNDVSVIDKDVEKEINRFEEVTYKGVYDLNKSFIVKSESASILDNEPDIVYMNNMEVNIYMNDGRIVTITSDKGSYNKYTYDCFFEENVKATDGEIIILSKNVDLIASEDTASVYNNVVIKNKNNFLKADKVDYNFETKIYHVSMFDKNRKVKGKLVQ